MYKRNCPTCGKELSYQYLGIFNKANKMNYSCSISCSKKKIKKEKISYSRLCPICNKEIIYNVKSSYEKAIKYNMACGRKCANIKGHLRISENKKLKKQENINLKKYNRNCPICDKELIYENEHSFIIANKRNSTCSKECGLKKRKKNNQIKKNEYKRNCSVCDKEIIYNGLKAYEKAIKGDITCGRKCGNIKRYGIKQNIDYKRNCPICSKEIKYNSKLSYDKARKSNTKCGSCSAKIKNSLIYNKKYKRNCPVCNKELVYNTQHQFNTANKNNKCCSLSCGVKLSRNNPSYRQKMSEKFKGENNPMYGKPSPQGSGNGWSGHYKEVQFRSLNELFYLKYLFDNNIKFENGEKKKHRIEYEFNGVKSYGSDFYLLDTNEYIEIKPKKMINTPQNKAKFKAAKEKLGEKFKVLTEDDLNKISVEEMYTLYLKGDLKFDKRYEEKFLIYYENEMSE